MKARALFAAAVAVGLAGTAGAALAQQSISVRDNGKISIQASVTDVTRIGLVGDDRIRRIVKDTTSFQEINDEETGDVFLRYSGDQAKLVPETGFIITEQGRTIGYTLQPATNLGNQTILISVSGGGAAAASSRNAAAGGAAPAKQSFQMEATSASGGSGYADTLVAFVRAAIVKHAYGRQAPNRADGAVIATVAGSGMRARIIVVSGGARGRELAERNFQGQKTLAVWLEKQTLFPGERAWAIIVDRG